jgi:hypothetical protein
MIRNDNGLLNNRWLRWIINNWMKWIIDEIKKKKNRCNEYKRKIDGWIR